MSSSTPPPPSPPSESPPESTQNPHSHPLSDLVESIFSYDNNTVMLGALISLLLVILFVLLLHLYARWFLAHSDRRRRRRRRSRSSSSAAAELGRTSFALDISALSGPVHTSSKGLDSAAISAIPLFVFEARGREKTGDPILECVICLGGFDDGEAGRKLPACGHEFHVECVDMWLGSHSNCPICRAPVVVRDLNSNASGDSGGSAETVTSHGDGGVVVIDIASAATSADHHNAENSAGNDCASAAAAETSSPSSSSSSSFGCSLKRMLSRNRSESKVFPASTVVSE